MTISYTTAAANAKLDGTGLNSYIGNGAKLRIYSGSVPANADASIGAATLLAELTCGTPFGTVASKVLTAGSITADSSADATGTASFFRIYKSDGTTAVVQGTVGTSGADLNLNSTSIVATASVSVTSLTITEGN